MTENQQLAIRNFAQAVTTSYPPQTFYFPLAVGSAVKAENSSNFSTSRGELMTLLLMGEIKHHQMSEALALEYLAHLALKSMFNSVLFDVQLSPQTLEKSGHTQKGLDILLTDSQNMVYLGIDIKTRFGYSSYQRDGFGWNKKLLSPFIYLSLGNFMPDTKEETNVALYKWLRQYALPKIGTSGKIPHWKQFQIYLLSRIEKSLNGYLEKVRDFENYDNDYGLPTTKREFRILEEKLLVLQSLFTEMLQSQ